MVVGPLWRKLQTRSSSRGLAASASDVEIDEGEVVVVEE